MNLLDLPDPENELLAFPAYYCHQLASEINIDRDLPRLKSAGLLKEYSDRTEYSAGLLDGIASGKVPKDGAIPPWEYQGGTTPSAIAHYATSVSKEAAYLTSLDLRRRLIYAKKWLNDAVAHADKLKAVAKDQQPLHHRTEVTHQRTWLSVFDDFLRRRSS